MQAPRSSSDDFWNRRWSSVLARFRMFVRPAPACLAPVRRFIRAVAGFALGDHGFVAVAMLAFVLGLGVSWFPASKSRQQNEVGPCHRVEDIVRLAGPRHEARGQILIVRIERAPGQGSIELHPRGEATCDAADLDLLIPPVPNVIFRRRGLFFEPLVPPRRRDSPLFLIPFDTPDRLTGSSPPHSPRGSMIDIVHHHDHASVLLDGDLDWPRSGVDGRFERRRLVPWTEVDPETVDPDGLSQGGGVNPATIRSPPRKSA